MGGLRCVNMVANLFVRVFVLAKIERSELRNGSRWALCLTKTYSASARFSDAGVGRKTETSSHRLRTKLLFATVLSVGVIKSPGTVSLVP